jgi:hypothetical protein
LCSFSFPIILWAMIMVILFLLVFFHFLFCIHLVLRHH